MLFSYCESYCFIKHHGIDIDTTYVGSDMLNTFFEALQKMIISLIKFNMLRITNSFLLKQIACTLLLFVVYFFFLLHIMTSLTKADNQQLALSYIYFKVENEIVY